MKKVFLWSVVLMLFVFSRNVKAQEMEGTSYSNYAFGLKVGGGMFSPNTMWGFHAGSFIEVGIYKQLSITSEITWSMQKEGSLSRHLINIPALLRLHTDSGLFINAGLALDFNLLEPGDMEVISLCAGLGYDFGKIQLEFRFAGEVYSLLEDKNNTDYYFFQLSVSYRF